MYQNLREERISILNTSLETKNIVNPSYNPGYMGHFVLSTTSHCYPTWTLGILAIGSKYPRTFISKPNFY